MMITKHRADRILTADRLPLEPKQDPSAKRSPLPRIVGVLILGSLLWCVGCDQKAEDDGNGSIDENPTTSRPAPDSKRTSETVTGSLRKDDPVDDPRLKQSDYFNVTDDDWKRITARLEELEKEKELPKKSAEELLRSFIEPPFVFKPDDVSKSSWRVTLIVAWKFNRLVEKELRKRGPAIVPDLKKLYLDDPKWFHGYIYTGPDGPPMYVNWLCDQLLYDLDEEWRKQARKLDGFED